MNKSETLFKKMQKSRLIALLTPVSVDECVKVFELCEADGIILEIAFRSTQAKLGIEAVKAEHPDALLLAGTVLTREQAKEAIHAGAAGVVSADYVPEVVDTCVKNDVMCIPGGLSDVGKQLVQKAEGYRCSLDELRERYPYQWIYKLFPAFSENSSHMELARAWRGPFRDLVVVYTGGITLDRLPRAVKTDAQGIFCASALTQNKGKPSVMKKDFQRWTEILKSQDRKDRESEGSELSRIEPTSKPKVVTFGEMMMRLSPSPGVRLHQAKKFDLHFGGAEANVAVSIARFGSQALFVSVFPDNALGDNAVAALRQHGVDTRFILRKGSRLGIYFLEHGSGPRPSKVVYDRAFSSFSSMNADDFDWDQILTGADWFHWTGITPALSEAAAESLTRALRIAKEKKITVSADLNFRKKLWTEEEAQNMMTGLMPYVDTLIGNEEDPIRVFGLKPARSDVAQGKIDIRDYQKMAQFLMDRFGCRKVALTLRESLSASENYWSACLWDGKEFVTSQKHHIWIMDRVGAGDAFAAGLIHSFLIGKSDQEALNFGVAAACLKHTIRGDFNSVSEEEVERLAAGETSGRVVR